MRYAWFMFINVKIEIIVSAIETGEEQSQELLYSAQE